jgi:hypothetical protein
LSEVNCKKGVLQGLAEARMGVVTLIVPPFVSSELVKQTFTISVGLAERATVNVADTPNSFVLPLMAETTRLPEFEIGVVDKRASRAGVGLTLQETIKNSNAMIRLTLFITTETAKILLHFFCPCQ